MLYEFHDTVQRTFQVPFTTFADAGSMLFSHPQSPLAYTPVSRQIAATYALLHRLGKDYEKPAWNLHETLIDSVPVRVSEHTVIHHPFCKLVHFRRHFKASGGQKSDHRSDPTVLLVAPLSGHHATLLRDTVTALLPAHEVFVTDWVDARLVPLKEGEFHLNDYVAYVQEFIGHLTALAGQPIHVISVCQPTVPVLAAISLMAAQKDACLPRSMTMMGGPIDTRQSPTEVNKLATTKPLSWFENTVIHRVPVRWPGAGRRVYPGFLQHAGFVAMNPDRHLRSHYDFYLHLIKGDEDDAEAHRRFYDEYNAVLDMPAEYYLETLRVVFQEHLLPTGRWEIEGQLVAPHAITNVALLTIEGELDDISGQGQTHAAHTLCSNIAPEHRQQLTARCGHYGIFSGRRWRTEISPQVIDFIRRHDRSHAG